jgi:opacity protein-like surface antigen
VKKLGLLVVFAISGTAHAQPAPPPPTAPGGSGGDVGSSATFGEKGHLAVDGSARVSIEYVSTSPPSGSMAMSSSTTEVVLEPALDYFVAPNISLGGGVEYLHASLGSGGMNQETETAYGILVRGGYNIPLGPQIGLWVRGGFEYAHASFDVGMGMTDSSSLFSLIIDAPLVYHPVPHFFVGFGPVLRTDLSSSIESGGMSADGEKTTSFGLTSVIGGWL